MPSDKYPGHYCTYLEMSEKPPKEVGVLDSGMPSYMEKDLLECAYFPAYVFLSKTEKHSAIVGTQQLTVADAVSIK